ncbi:MAG: sugar transferase [Clostridia bacterium]|nr:sugar transferase [Clostridia bacterium]
MKRLFDFIFSVAMLVILLPLFILISFAIKLTSRGPVLFKQRRIGKDKAEFNIYKFRSMYAEAPKDVPTHLLQDASRYITPIGKFLRKTSLDELPQLLNIIKGDMSFVGPRPALYNQHDLISLREKCNVNSIRPGITGWAQVNGRDELEIPVKVEYDRYYAEHMSLWFDFKIVIMTVFSVLRAKGVVEGAAKSGSDGGISAL